jgi:glycosyltransferase involved in cell wall biosynthesis
VSSSDLNSGTVVLIPAYQAESTIAELVRPLVKFPIPVFVVDDASTDQTGEKARTAGARVIQRAVNGGKGAALRTGIEEILKDRSVQWILMMDADRQHLPEEIPNFFEQRLQRTEADLLIGNRMDQPTGMPVDRSWTNRFMSHLISLWAGQKIPDSQCGFRLVSRRLLERVRLRSDHFEIESELIVRAARAGFRIASVPIRCVYPSGRVSFILPFLDTLRFIRLLMQLSLDS